MAIDTVPRLEREGGGIRLEQIWADNLSHNLSLVTDATKVVAVCAAIVAIIWALNRLFSAKGGRLGMLLSLWVTAKERELRSRAGVPSDH